MILSDLIELADKQINGLISEAEFIQKWRKYLQMQKLSVQNNLKRKFKILSEPTEYWIDQDPFSKEYKIYWEHNSKILDVPFYFNYSEAKFNSKEWSWIQKSRQECADCRFLIKQLNQLE